MQSLIDTLDPPVFLVAMPQVIDPFFNRSVVLLLEHSTEGTLGIIVNRPVDLTVQSALVELGIPWRGSADAHVYFGGPVQPNVGTALFGEGGGAEVDPARVAKVSPGLRMAHDVTTLAALASAPPERFRLFLGYGGWSEGQLEEELARNDWLVVPFDPDLLFSSDGSFLWAAALEKIGVRPESLPSWTMPEEEKGN
jgi:putative transcriptional regulator